MQALSAAAKGEERVCVIGCGKSGLIGCKVLTQRGVAFDCFEEGSQVWPGPPPACWTQFCRFLSLVTDSLSGMTLLPAL